MKKQMWAVFAGGAALWAVAAQGSVVLNLASVPGSEMQFNGSASTFQFNEGSSVFFPQYNGKQWKVVSEGTGSASVGDFGDFGPIAPSTTHTIGWQFGAISLFAGGLETAPVTSPSGTMISISDGNNGTLQGALNWGTIQTVQGNGAINASLVLNITGITYTGSGPLSNPDFITLKNDTEASMVLSFSFAPGMTLQQLSAGSGPYTAAYSGSLTDANVPPPHPPYVPEAGTTIAGGVALGLVALALGMQRRKALF